MRFPVVVMKFGGTSVATEEGRRCLIDRVRAISAEGARPVVVVSAMGRVGDPYATDTLCSLVPEAVCDLRDRDLLMSVGETISSLVVTCGLEDAGIPARRFSGATAGIVTSSDAGEAQIEEIDVSAIEAALEEGRVPVVAGFQGIDRSGLVTTLGRGGSDTTACALGVALEADHVDIYKDVDGIMTSDPHICAEASLIERISQAELFEMSNAGAKVVHTPAAELALHCGIPMRIRNTFSGSPGTEVVDLASYRPTRVVTAVTTQRGIARIRVTLPHTKEDSLAHMKVQTEAFELMAAAGVSVDMFTPVNDRLIFSIDQKSLSRALAALEGAVLDCAVREGLSKVTAIGAGMHGVVGVMARIERALCEAGIDVLQSADSHATISVLVDSACEGAAVRALHDEFDL